MVWHERNILTANDVQTGQWKYVLLDGKNIEEI